MTSRAGIAPRYAERYHWSLLPAHTVTGGRCSCGKADCSSPGKHPRTPNGLKDASTDPAVIAKWFEQWPNANIAVVPGPSGLVVADIDSKIAERVASWLGLCAEPTLTALTGRTDFPGRHLYFRYTGPSLGNLKVTVSDDHLIAVRTDQPGLEIKHDRGYVIAPPSMHVSGRQYRWLRDGYEPQPLPGRATALLLLVPQHPPGPRDAEDGPGLHLSDGRKTTLARIAGSLRRLGCSAQQIDAMLSVLNTDFRPPLPPTKVAGIAGSIARYPPDPPAITPPTRTQWGVPVE
jgi:hypothetical protein